MTASAPLEPTPTSAPRPRVLVVEDDEHMRELLLESLAQDGFTVLGAASAANALDLLQSEAVHAVVTDLNLGGMNGAWTGALNPKLGLVYVPSIEACQIYQKGLDDLSLLAAAAPAVRFECHGARPATERRPKA